ncbi:MAG TPA: ATP-binding protein [Bryobacteraceae bacterium]|nr:ATP-binding protein [Bryobacteraceae bacterium]
MSVTAKILAWCLGTLLFSWVAFIGVSLFVASHAESPATTSSAAQTSAATQLNTAIQAYEAGGAPALAKKLQTLRRSVYGKYHLLDSHGRDVVTGEDRGALTSGLRPGDSRQATGQPIALLAAANQRFSLVWVSDWDSSATDRLSLKDFIPYYLLIILAVGVLFWLLAWNIASPVRKLADSVERFGSGDLSVRVNSSRKDEIGNLSRTFDRMAESIATLLTAERRLLQDISHELRSPLARLSFAAELTRTAEDRDAAAGRLKKEISRLTNLVGALIQVTRAEGDPSLHHTEEFPLDELVHEVVEDYRETNRILVEAEQSIIVRGDRELLRRTVENILQNAIRYGGDDHPVEVKLELREDAARLSIRDHGPGVPDQALPKIFQPFFRVDDSRDNATGGVGLGLAIAGRAVSLHHGRLWAENARPGLRVIVELPIASGGQFSTGAAPQD